MKEELPNLKINVDKNQITQFLEQQLQEKDRELYQKINSCSYNPDDMELIVDNLKLEKYTFEPYSLEYFKRNVMIYREKSLRLFYLITDIINAKKKDFLANSSLIDKLNRYDIKVDSSGNIYYSDIDRLVNPFVYNLDNMLEKLEEANSLNTYLNFHISKESIYEYGMDEDELYPDERLQLNEISDNEDGFIPLSDKQILNFGINILKENGKIIDIDSSDYSQKKSYEKNSKKIKVGIILILCYNLFIKERRSGISFHSFIYVGGVICEGNS